ncbi:MAG TPA: hypothetical protein PK620_15100, partial [Denitromonas sp.]|nr:hypothetical protein [Denitromonas sp.]
ADGDSFHCGIPSGGKKPPKRVVIFVMGGLDFVGYEHQTEARERHLPRLVANIARRQQINCVLMRCGKCQPLRLRALLRCCVKDVWV